MSHRLQRGIWVPESQLRHDDESALTGSVVDTGSTQALTGKDLTSKTNTLSPANVGLNYSPNAYISGNYYLCNGWQWTSTVGSNPAYNNLPFASPWVVTNDITITRLFLELTAAGDANSVFRLAIWNHNPSTQMPGTALLDAGTISMGSGNAGNVATGGVPGVYERTVSQALTPGLWWIGGIIQGVTTTAPTLRATQIDVPHVSMPLGTSLPGVNAVSGMVFSFTAMSGAVATYPSTYAPTTITPRIGFKVA